MGVAPDDNMVVEKFRVFLEELSRSDLTTLSIRTRFTGYCL